MSKEISLNGQFKMYSTNGSNAVVCYANIPASDFGALIENDKIENPLNSHSQEDFDLITTPIQNDDICFERDFEIDSDILSYSHIELCCAKIDTLCKCYINDKLAFESNNAYVPITVDIKHLLNRGLNNIKICIDSAVKYIEAKQNEHKLPKNPNGIDGASYIRKSACHFGWDWGPCVAYKYVGDIKITAFNRKINDIKITQKQVDGKAEIIFSATNCDNAKMIAPDGEAIFPQGNKFIVEKPALWYTRDLSLKDTQPLYTIIFENDEMQVERKIGIRKIELNTEADEFGNNFQIRVNGKRVFCKGANVIPFSVIPEFADNATIDYYLDLCVKSNFNIIRIWGGGEYASDYLLSRCDELGILVWQDFQFACLMYPFYDNDFLHNVLNEARVNVERLSTHPSLALLCGNNELEAMYSYLPKSTQLVKSYIEFFYHTLPEHIKDICDVPYIPTSPIGDKPFSKNSADEVGDTHMWNVWHGLKPLNYYERRFTRFMSEFGLESLPSMKAIKTFADESDYDLKSDAFMSHQKCIGGNEKMMFYLKERFNAPKHFEDLPYLTGIVQAECVKYATEHFRRHKGRCNGSIFWQLNDVWNCPSWSSVDYEGVPKALMYMATDFCAPITFSVRDNQIYGINDTLFDQIFDLDINGEIKKVTLPADSVTKIEGVNCEITCLKYQGRQQIFDNVKNLKRATITSTKKGRQITVKSDVFAKYVYIECDAIADKNYFSLMPNEEITITFNKDFDSYKIICENNIEFKRNNFIKGFSQFIYRLKPMNIANAFYYEHN